MNVTSLDPSAIWHDFHTDLTSYDLPSQFTFPFYYEPHPIAKLAASELQRFLMAEWNQGTVSDSSANEISTGKMFGVLVVRNRDNKLGYLTAYSGKLPKGKNQLQFVPPIFDLFAPDSFFLNGERELNQINKDIENLQQNADFLFLKKDYAFEQQKATKIIEAKKAQLRDLKAKRKLQRLEQEVLLSAEEYLIYNDDLIKQSLRDKHDLNVLNADLALQLSVLSDQIVELEYPINQLKELRKHRSNALQQRLFDQYNFLNARGELKNVVDVFKETALLQPPAAAGDCAAPRLLQYAYQNDLQPIALAEFWWGTAPKSEIRKHGYFYPACRGKCEPILSHMLQGLDVEDNPLLVNPALGVSLDIIYEDDVMVVVNKPAEFLSVPGIYIQDSVYQRMRARYPKATGPLIVHRLDMSTSGLLVLAKNKEAHQHLQCQFIKRTVKKRYAALLNGSISNEEGLIDLPLRVDLDDRPRQLVCYDYGKPALTKYQIIESRATHTLIHFWPITGRTHQLRVHAAHSLGLNCAILGDDLYGQKSDRLYLHAESLELIHPVTGEKLHFEIASNF
ncbi:RluA family pseudouridine synthase [Flavobacterium sp. HSC-61S13]|uniref:RluA family pseudouridine synthase n=1 Tax=Flavobacterium sp. HSC-61S13 TaxID=2910963 RepID=UPI00209C7E87|nr:pseudouridine synthase [Flavobacterium sp. HSC-61S13]MCP1995551.1 tRNA pseudouridine32 synthase/23S rRNA pseudouridine746 synthase [Flavobacterium sp. HSC-61S13]